MAAALREAMSLSPEARRTMGANGRAWMERDFDWRAIAGQMADVYRWLASGGERPECVRVS
jgi:glycosyltransferase involved in cell wall biosynthesis